MPTPPSSRPAAFWLTGFLAASIILLALRGLLQPVAMAHGFGLPLVLAEDRSFVQVYASRNMVLGVFCLLLALRRDWLPLAQLVSACSLLPLVDVSLVLSRSGPVPALGLHALIEALLVTLAVLLWREVRRAAPSRSPGLSPA